LLVKGCDLWFYLVGVTGFEPATSSSRIDRSASQEPRLVRLIGL